MRHRGSCLLWVLVLGFGLAVTTAPETAAATEAVPGAATVTAEGAEVHPLEAIPGELIVKLAPSVEPADVAPLQAALAATPGGGETTQLFAGLPGYSALLARHPARAARVTPESMARGEESLARLEDVFVVRVDPSTDMAALVADLRASPDVVYVEPNLLLTLSLVPDDPFYLSSGSWGQPYDDMWALKKLRPEPAWDRATGSGIVVAVSDTGLDYTHVEIAGRVWINAGEDLNGNGVVDGDPLDCDAVPPPPPSGDFNCVDDDGNGWVDDVRGYDVRDRDSDVIDPHGHGTHVSGTIAAEGLNATGIIGVAFDATIMPVKAFGAGGSGTLEDGAESVLYAAANGADVVNMSWGGYGDSQLLRDAMIAAHDLGLVLVAAAGNDSMDVEGAIPASFPEVIAVAALDHLDVPADFSNFGDGISVSAPGGDSEIAGDPDRTFNNVLSLKASGNPTMGSPLLTVDEIYYRARGTSMASPHAAGVAALILSRQPALSNALVQIVLEQSAEDIGTPGFDAGTGHGRVDAFAAVELADLAATRSELIAKVVAEPVAAAGSPIDVEIEVENAGPVAAGNVVVRLFHGDPDLGGTLLREWTVATIGADPFETSTVVELAASGAQPLFLVADPGDQVVETSETNNTSVATVNVLSFQYVERTIASDAGLTPAGSVVSQRNPSVSGDRVVWTDDRHDTAAPEIYLYDLSTGTERRITSTPSAKSSPSISGDRIVWLDRRDGSTDVYLYDLALDVEVPITQDSFTRSSVRIDGDRIVWSDNRNGNQDVYLYDLASGGPEVAITTDPTNQTIPEIDGDRVVWTDPREGDSDIWLYTLPSGPEAPITSGPVSEVLPDVGGNRFAWTEVDTSGPLDLSIRMLDLDGPPYLSVIDSGGADWDPALSGTDLAWIHGLLARRVHAMDLATGAITELTTGLGATVPQADDGRIVWEEFRRSVFVLPDYDIFMAERNPFPGAPANLDARRDTAHSIRLTWSPGPDADVTQYAVYRRESAQQAWARVAETGGATSLVDSGLVTGRRYYYRVTAIDGAGGESPFSNEDSAVPNDPPPPCRKCPDIQDYPGGD